MKTSKQEKEARLHILKQLSYHRQYLEINDLHDCYDSVMKEVELGKSDWDTSLAAKVHQFCEFRSNLITRETIAKQAAGKQGASQQRKKESEERVFYCNEFNRQGGCNFPEHHEGRFNNRTVQKWHICRRCFSETKEKRFHPELDKECPRRQN